MISDYPTRVLLVHENPEILKEWQAILNLHESVWLTATTADEAQALMHKNGPDLVIYQTALFGNNLSDWVETVNTENCCQLLMTDNQTPSPKLTSATADRVNLPEELHMLPIRARHLLSQKAFEQLIEKSESGFIDPLSGLFNGQMLHDLGEKELNRCQRYQRPFSLATIKIENLKSLNNQYGFRAGDSLIKQLSGYFSQSFRQSDLIARIGEREFVILFPESTQEQCREKVNRLIDEIVSKGLDFDSQPLNFSLAVGMAELDTGDLLLEQIIQRANVNMIGDLQQENTG